MDNLSKALFEKPDLKKDSILSESVDSSPVTSEEDIDFSQPVGDIFPANEAVVLKKQASSHNFSRFVQLRMNCGDLFPEAVAKATKRYFAAHNSERDTLKRLASLNGIVGFLAVDLTGEKQIKPYLKKVASVNPYKNYIRCIIGSSADLETVNLPVVTVSNRAGKNRKAFDDFFAGDHTKETFKTYKKCRESGLMVMAENRDLPEDMLDDSIVIMADHGIINAEEHEKIKGCQNKMARSRIAFTMLKNKTERKLVASSVNAPIAQGMSTKSDYILPVNKKVIAKDAVKITKINAAAMDLDVDDSMVGELVTPNANGKMDIEDEFYDKPTKSDIELNPETYIDDEFKGGDEIVFDEKPKAAKPALDIRLNDGFNL